jgi:uncharacterized protein YaaQ
MPKIREYTQQTTAQGGINTRRATAEDFGANPFGDMANAVNQIQQVQQKKQSRLDTIQRVRALNEYDTFARDQLTQMQAEQDFTDPSVLSSYGEALAEKRDELLQGHGGSEDSRLQLNAMLEQSRGSHAGIASKTAIESQKALVNNHISSVRKTLADTSAKSPDMILEHMASWDAEVDQMSGALTEEEQTAHRITGRGEILKSGVQTLMIQGDLDQVEQVLTSKVAVESLPAADMRSLKLQVVKKRRENEIESNKGLQKLQETAQILGVSVDQITPEQRLRLAGLAPKEGATTFADKVADAEAVLGRPLNESERQNIIGLESSQPDFGRGITGQSLNILNDSANAVAYGLADEREVTMFESALNEYMKPQQYKDPQTGDIQTIRRTPARHILEAARRAGIPIPGGQVATGETPEQTPEVATDKFLDLSGENTYEGPSVWQSAGAGDVTGPIPAAREFVGRIPGVGGALGEVVGSRQVVLAREQIATLQRQLVTSLQQNPRFAVGEMERIEEVVTIEPSLMDNPTAYKQRLLARDIDLERLYNDAMKNSTDMRADAEFRKQNLRAAIRIQQFRERVGVPPRVKTVDEALSYPPGSIVIGPNGKEYRIPERGQNAAE